MIRRACLQYLPELAAMGIRPADLDDLYPSEIAYFVGLVAYRRENSNA